MGFLGNISKNVGGFIEDPLGTTDRAITQASKVGSKVNNPLQNRFSPNIQDIDYSPTAPVNNFYANVPANNFQASTPQFAHTDFASYLNRSLDHPYGSGPDMGSADATGANQGDFGEALLGRTNQTYGQQQNLINQLQGEASGQGAGASLAQNMLRQATDNNIKQGAGLIASQKGINPALAARLIAQNTGAANQNAAAQGANMGLQQQLAAQGQLGSLLSQQQGLDTSQLTNLYGTQRGQDISSTLGAGGLSLQHEGNIINGGNAQNTTDVNASLGAQGLDASTAAGTQRAGVDTNAQNASVAAGDQNAVTANNATIAGIKEANHQGQVASEQIKSGVAAGNAAVAKDLTAGAVGGGAAAATKVALGAAHGGKIPGRAKHKGDDPRNDTIPADLSPGEVVIPRSAANDPEKAAAFVAALKGGAKKNSGAKGYGKILEKHRELQSKMQELEALIKRSA